MAIVPIITASNLTTASIELTNVGITIPSGGQVIITDYLFSYEIWADDQIQANLASGNITFSDQTGSLNAQKLLGWNLGGASEEALWNASHIVGVPVDPTGISNGYVLQYNSSSAVFQTVPAVLRVDAFSTGTLIVSGATFFNFSDDFIITETTSGAFVDFVTGAIPVDELVKITSNDTTAGYLFSKLLAGPGIVLNEINDSGNESLAISASVSTPTIEVLESGTTAVLSASKINFSVDFDVTDAGSGQANVEYDHKKLRHLIHFIDGPADSMIVGAYKEIVGGLFPISVTWYTDSGKVSKIFQKVLVRSGSAVAPTPIIWRMFNEDGSTVGAEAQDDITYDGLIEVSRSRSINIG